MADEPYSSSCSCCKEYTTTWESTIYPTPELEQVHFLKSTFYNEADQPFVDAVIIPPIRIIHYPTEIVLPCWDDDCKEKTAAIVVKDSYYHNEFIRLGFFHARFTNKNNIDCERGILEWWDAEFERWRKIEEIPP